MRPHKICINLSTVDSEALEGFAAASRLPRSVAARVLLRNGMAQLHEAA